MQLDESFSVDDDRFADPDGQAPFMEGMSTHATDPERGVSVLAGLYRDLHDKHESWHNISVVLPDGRAAWVLDYPRLSIGSVIQSGNLRYEQIEPFSRWRYTFDGPAEYARQEDTLDPATCRREPGQLAFQIDVECVTPPWSPPSTVFGSGAKPGTGVNVFGVYVQNYRFSGWVRDDTGSQTAIDGVGWRHHVRSQLWGGEIFGHSFIHVLFPSGRAFGLQVAELTSGVMSGFGYIFDGERLHQCTVRSLTAWSKLVFKGEPVVVVLEREDGTQATITGETLNNVAVVNLSEKPQPPDRSDPDALFTLFGDTRWSWDGETGYGTWERTRLVRALED